MNESLRMIATHIFFKRTISLSSVKRKVNAIVGWKSKRKAASKTRVALRQNRMLVLVLFVSFSQSGVIFEKKKKEFQKQWSVLFPMTHI